MKVQLTVLTENTAKYGFLAEWGLSILVEADGSKVLMDTGLSMSALHNAPLLGVDFARLDAIVLSHGHADHTGGLREVLKRAGRKNVIAHPNVWDLKYGRTKDAPDRHIGLPFLREELESLGASFTLSDEPLELSQHMVTSGEVPMLTDFEEIGEGLYRKMEQGLEPDPLADDLSMAVKTEEGLVVILGCAHRGVINVIRQLRDVTGEERVYAVVGGTHLVRASEDRIQQTIQEFRQMGIKKVACCHCTGFRASARMADAFGDSFVMLNAGDRLTI